MQGRAFLISTERVLVLLIYVHVLPFQWKVESTSQREYVGCFIDDAERMYDYPDKSHGLVSNIRTVENCASYCLNKKHIYSAVQYSTSCFCGNVIPGKDHYNKVADSECNMHCGGKSEQICGGAWRNSVYKDCSVLPAIPYPCLEFDCDTPSEKWCIKCNEATYYKLIDNACKHKCSSRNRWCWPGSCDNELASNCSCMTGFERVVNSNRAMCQPTIPPQIDSCRITAVADDGTKTSSSTSSEKCSEQTNFYGKFNVSRFQVTVNTFIHITIEKHLESIRAMLPFKPREHFRISDVVLIVSKDSISQKRQIIMHENIHVPSNSGRDFGAKDVNMTNTVTVKNGDKLCVTIQVQAGGDLEYENEINHVQSSKSYDKTRNDKTLCYICDKMIPKHCSVASSCGKSPLLLSRRITKSRYLKLRFGGWLDPYPIGGSADLASGIESYGISIHEVELANDILMRRNDAVGNPKTIVVNSSYTSLNVELPEKSPMLYAILIEVKDKANNARQARRFVLFDNSSAISINQRNDFRVTSATNESRYGNWQTNHKQFCFSWHDRFFNNEIQTFLHPIRPDKYTIYGVYDQIDGVLPHNGTKNINGISLFHYFLNRNNTTVLSGLVYDQSVCLRTMMSDGDSFTFTVEASDISGNKMNDTVKVYIDRSVPDINDAWLMRDSKEELFVHHSTDLSKINLQFKAFDIHSGLKEVKWAFGLYENQTSYIEKATAVITVDEVAQCGNITDCYCPILGKCSKVIYNAELRKLLKIGNHNRRYYFTIKVTNTANLVAIEHLDILVDESPPEVGTVLEGSVGDQDIDYTSQKYITIHWHGFIDHESRIKLYKVAIARFCLSDIKYFEWKNHSSVAVYETTFEELRVEFPDGEGRYIASVVAFNNAMSPSKIVCSDGITFDRTKPTIRGVTLKHANIKESIACHENKSWLITEQLYKVQLSAESCIKRCMDSSSHNITGFIPEKHHQDKNETSIGNFLCRTLPMYDNNIIYTSSDLFEISWNASDPESEIDHVYIGFGNDVSYADAPDISNYAVAHQNSHYIQHHPSLIGEKPVYIFIKVLNKAGLVSRAWLGPILPDETPPICDNVKLVPFVDGRYLIINWTKTMFYDIEQTEEIGKVLFRFGVSDYLFTPFHEWNIKLHGGQCEKSQQCIKYPVRKLQKYDSKEGSLFYAQLHIYNNAGHFCSLNTLRFRLPSLFPPTPGVVIDIQSINAQSFDDVDVLLDATIFCFHWSGFSHHEHVEMQVGLGSKLESDNIIPYHRINSTTEQVACENLQNIKEGYRYFATIKASCSGGTTIVSSDGFTVLDKNDIMSSLQVVHTDTCEHLKITSHQTMNGTIEITLTEQLLPWKTYTLMTNSIALVIHEDMIIKRKLSVRDSFVTVFIPKQLTDKLVVKQISKKIFDLQLYRCDFGLVEQQSTKAISVLWSIGSQYTRFVTHYEGAVCKVNNTTSSCSDTLLLVNLGNVTYHTFHGQYNGKYISSIRPCFRNICLGSVVSNGVNIEMEMHPIIIKAFGKQENACYRINVTVESIEKETLLIKWAVFHENHKRLSEWKFITQQNSTKHNLNQDSECIILPVYQHKRQVLCVQVLTMSGRTWNNCSVIKSLDDPNSFDKNVVYDLNMNHPFTTSLREIAHSSNLGNKLTVLHNEEMDFANSSVRVGGFIVGRSSQKIIWYLMKKPEISGKPCSFDLNCIFIKNTTGGFVDFENPRLKFSGLLYICLEVQTSPIESYCSNGFLVDDKRPKAGVVEINSHNGFVTDGSILNVEWSGFTGNKEAVQLGYLSDLSYYLYAIGTSVGSDDILDFQPTELSTSVSITGLRLSNGGVYYASIKAYDHFGRHADAHSGGVIYDVTLPTMGRVLVDSHNGYISSHRILVEWENVEDKESGIRAIEVGIGSSKNSVDIHPFTEYTSRAEIAKPHLFQDGHAYYAMLKVTNGAGLVSRSVSDPFIVDNTPPSSGHVIEVKSLNSMNDVDYQIDVNTIIVKWFGFFDHHSNIQHYMAGLGTRHGSDDIIQLASVGLQKHKTWSGQLFQGVRYYTTVKACNGAGLCTSVSTNSVIMDSSKPVPGMVVIGDPGKHSRYISNTKRIKASWIGFDDPQSGISHFEVCIETVNDTCNIKEWLNVQLSAQIIRSDLNMTDVEKIRIIVKACNKVGLCSVRSSPYSRIDTSPPSLVEKPFVVGETFDKSKSRKVLIDSSFFTIKWKFGDEESPIVKTLLSIHSETSTHVPVENLDLENIDFWVFQLKDNHILRQGDIYIAQVTSCNAASLCTTAVTDEFIVDSTPPQIGGFNFPIEFSKKPSSNEISITLSWYGFFDIESDIKSYFLSIGHSYSENQVLSSYVLNDSVTISLVLNATAFMQNSLVLSIRAENYASLSTPEVKVTTSVISDRHDQSEGHLLLQRHSCKNYYCDSECKFCDCTCAAVGKKCVNDKHAQCSWLGLNATNSPFKANITIITENAKDRSGSSKCLKVMWKTPSGDSVLRYEYSFGVSGSAIGSGVYNLSLDNPWHDAGMLSEAVHCLPPGMELVHKMNYTAYIRVWTSYELSYTFSSSPVIIDHTPPHVHKRRVIKDITIPSSCSNGDDVDYIVSRQEMEACWEDVFYDEESGIRSYSVALGTLPSWDDIVQYKDVGGATSIEWLDLRFEPGVRYFASVRAVNSLGLQTELSSNGFVLDVIAPTTGVIYNTRHHGDVLYQSVSEPIEFSWHGFEDQHSFVNSYQIAIDVDGSMQGNVSFIDVGLVDHFRYKQPVQHLQKIKAILKAIDKAGHESMIIQSQPLTVDGTAPISFTCKKFESFSNLTTKITDKNEFQWNEHIELARHELIRLQINVSAIMFGFETYLYIGNVAMQLPFVVNADDSVVSDYTYLSPENSTVNVSITSYGIPLHSIVNVLVSKCEQVETVDTGSRSILAKQISTNALSVCVNTIDPESGIKYMFLSVGSIANGHEIVHHQPLSHGLHAVLQAKFTHGMAVFVQAEIENQAGIQTVFTSDEIVIDHTAPVINVSSSGLLKETNSSIVRVILQYIAEDPESGIQYCEYCLGPIKETCEYVPWTVLHNVHSLTSVGFTAHHGANVYGIIRCINDVQLAGNAGFGPLTVSIIPPTSETSQIEFITDTGINLDSQQDASSLSFRWNEFKDDSEITSYSTRVIGQNGRVSSWVDVEKKNYVRWSDLGLTNKQSYEVSLKAKNTGGLESTSVKSSILVSDETPYLTGASVHLQHSNVNSYRLSWKGVFNSDVIDRYQVAVGAIEGGTGVVMPTTVTDDRIDVSLPPELTQVFVVIDAISSNGLTTTYRETIII